MFPEIPNIELNEMNVTRRRRGVLFRLGLPALYINHFTSIKLQVLDTEEAIDAIVVCNEFCGT